MITTRGAFFVVAMAALALPSAGCANTSSCSRAPDSVTIPLGGMGDVPDAGDELEAGVGPNAGSFVEGNTYRSAPFGGPYTFFPAFRTVTFEHGLNAIPYAMQFWLAFTNNGTLAPSAGNMTELPAPQDGGEPAVTDQKITVYNNTCSQFYLWVVAERSAP